MTDEQLLKAVTNYRQYQTEQHAAEVKKNAVGKEIKEELAARSVDILDVGIFTVSHRHYTKKVFDQARFREENPELAKKYMKKIYIREFKVA